MDFDIDGAFQGFVDAMLAPGLGESFEFDVGGVAFELAEIGLDGLHLAEVEEEVAFAGEVLELFGVGFGPTDPPVAAGKAVTAPAKTINPVSVSIGGVQASVPFAGIVAAGQYQINVVVPNVPSGDQPLLISVNNAQAPSVFIPIQ